MNKGYYRILNNEPVSPNGATGAMSVWKMVLEGDTASITAPGQFVNIAVPGRYLRRPISICDWTATENGPGTITIVYRIVGGGTMDLSALRPGTEIGMISGLGNGFSLEGTAAPLLVGGGVGLPPMLGLARGFLDRGISPTVVAGFSSASDIILTDDFQRLGLDIHIATMDGSAGTRGTVIDAIRELQAPAGVERGPENVSLRSTPPSASLPVPPLTQPRVARFSAPLSTSAGAMFDRFYACGPKPMLKALSALPMDGQLSVEERMGCGFGICMGCSCKTKSGMKRVCKEGPVFRKEDLIW